MPRVQAASLGRAAPRGQLVGPTAGRRLTTALADPLDETLLVVARLQLRVEAASKRQTSALRPVAPESSKLPAA